MFFPTVREQVLPLFRPNESVVRAVDIVLEEARKHCEILVGVHIRRGDYREWKDGQYFYSNDVYASYMRQMEQLFTDKKVAFYIASNESVSADGAFDAFQIYHGAGGSAEDLYALQQCDYIIGPPSIFPKWASIMGKSRYTSFLIGMNNLLQLMISLLLYPIQSLKMVELYGR